jgi:uncharacterized membrane-anchored protein YhcB (DUF1043 family)
MDFQECQGARRVSVLLPAGKTITIQASPVSTIAEIKQHIMEAAQFPTGRQILFLKDQRLTDKERLLTDYNFPDRSLLTLTLREFDPVEMIKKLEAGSLKPEIVGLPKDCGFPTNIFMNLSTINEVKAYCVICKKILRDAMEIDCDCFGKICKCCLQTAKPTAVPGEGSKYICFSNDYQRHINLDDICRSRTIRSLIGSQIVKCNSTHTFNGQKCQWTGTITQLDKHIISCNFQQVACPFNCGVKDFCKGEMITEGHYSNCPGFFLKCTHCADFFKRQEFAKHVEICPEMVSPCIFKCGETLRQRDTEKHNRDNCVRHTVFLKKDLGKQERRLAREVTGLENKLTTERKMRQELERKLADEKQRREKLQAEVDEHFKQQARRNHEVALKTEVTFLKNELTVEERKMRKELERKLVDEKQRREKLQAEVDEHFKQQARRKHEVALKTEVAGLKNELTIEKKNR